MNLVVFTRHQTTDKTIGERGALSFSEALKTNTALSVFHLRGLHSVSRTHMKAMCSVTT